MKYQFLSLSLYKLIILLVLILTINSCKEDPLIPPEPPPVIPKDTINISVADYTHRSISVNIKSTENNPSSAVRLYRIFNSSETLLSEYPITVNDTTIIDDDNGTGLLLNTEYFYYAVRIDTTGERKDSSNFMQAATLDTTSHNYTWQEWVIGDWQSSLYDVWGTDENNVWAVGSIIHGSNFFGALNWNGSEWIPYDNVGGTAIFGFNANDIWVVGGGVFYFNGTDWIDLTSTFDNYRPYTSVWGTSSSNMYFGTEWGKIIQWDGTKASEESIQGELAIQDILGFGMDDIYAVDGYLFSDRVNRLYHFNGSTWSILKEAVSPYPQGEYLAKPLLSLYGRSSNDLYVAGGAVHRRLNGIWIYPSFNPQVTVRIRGTNYNNIIAVGSLARVYHYNGIQWNNVSPPANNNKFYKSAYVTENKIFLVGGNGSNAIILIGTKN